MAGTSARDVKNRIKSVQATMHITKAMELVASSKLRKAKARVERSRSFFESLQSTLHDIAEYNMDLSSVFVREREVKKRCFVVVAGDRGLAGGYNGNVFKLWHEEMTDEDSCVLPIGKKTLEFFRQRGTDIVSSKYEITANITLEDCAKIGKLLAKKFASGEFDELHIIYTKMNSMISQSPHSMKLLPVTPEKNSDAPKGYILYEPSEAAVFNAIVPEYIAGMLYGAVCESSASELAARRMAMDAATKNADEMIGDLTLKFNRARQAAITSEITEIVAGAGA